MRPWRKIFIFLQKLWQFYTYTRNSPETIGPSFFRKVLIILMYCASFVCALYMAFIIIVHQPVFRTINEWSEGTYFEVPSAILCPGKNNIYNYSFLYEEKWISEVGLPIEAVNILAKADKEDALGSPQAAAALDPHIRGLKAVSNMKPKEVWRKIISWMYYNPGMYQEKARFLNNKFHKTSVDIDCSEGRKVLFENYFNCTLVSGIWLKGNRYCFIWNNTGRKALVDPKSNEVQVVPNLSKFNHIQSYYFWIGNLLTDQIVFDEAVREKQSGLLKYRMTSYKIDGEKDTVCQSQIQNSCRYYVPKKLNTHWVYVKSREREARRIVRFIIDIGASWFEVKHVNRFTGLEIFEVLGNALGMWIGLSIMTVLKTVLVVMKKLVKTKSKLIIFVQMTAIAVLVCSTAVLQIWKYNSLQYKRFIYQLNVQTNDGAPYPDVHFCTEKLAAFNLSEIKRYNISYPLLTYITSTAILHYPAQDIDFKSLSTEPSLSKKKDKPFFLYDANAPPEVGYHWSFMQFPLQYISENLYEEQMTKIEMEYENLCKKLGIEPSEPSWIVMKTLLLDPCKVIKFCFINDEFVESCCIYFRNVVVGQVDQYHACWQFHNENLHLRQTHAGKHYGLRVYIDADQMAHAMPNVWLDNYLHQYMINCSASYNCSTQKAHEDTRHLFFKIMFNKLDTNVCPLHVKVSGTTNQAKMRKKNFEVTVTENLHLSYHKNDCLDHMQPLNLFQYVKQEILFKKCGCYVCHDPPVYYTQRMPCCTPKVVGRCITQMDMYESRCYENGSFNHKFYRGINVWQYRYGGNLPVDAPVNFMIHGEYPCTMKALFSEGSKFHELYQQFLHSRSQLKKPPCHFFSVKVDRGIQGNYRRHVLEIKKRNMSLVWPQRKIGWHLTFYYTVPVYFEFEERDLQNFWELFGLFCGALGLCLGLTYMSVAEHLIDGPQKVFKFLKQKTNSESIADAFANYSLSKLTKKLEHFWQHPHTTTVEIISLKNDVNVQHLKENNEVVNTTLVNKVKPHGTLNAECIQDQPANKNDRTSTLSGKTTCEKPIDVDYSEKMSQKDESSSSVFPTTTHECAEYKGSKKVILDSKQAPSEMFPSTGEECEDNKKTSKRVLGVIDESKSDPEELNALSKLLLDILCCILLLSAISLTLLSCIQLQQSMKVDQVIVHFDLKDTDISPPTVGVCIADKPKDMQLKHEENLTVSFRKLLESLQKCHIQNKPVSCQKLFSFFTWNWQYECIFTNYKEFDLKASQLEQHDLEVEIGSIEESLTFFWAGDMKTVYDGILTPGHTLGQRHEKSAAYIKYQQWQVTDSGDCEDQLNVFCPKCNHLPQQINNSFCCTWGMYLNFNISAPQVKHCSSSFYEISYSTLRSTESEETGKKTVLTLSSEVNVKRVISREQRRTLSEQLMLYAGYIDLFIGINVDNMIIVLATIIKNFVVWIISVVKI